MIPFVDIHTHHFSNLNEVISLRSVDVNEYLKQNEISTFPFSMGLHPWSISKENSVKNLSLLEEVISKNAIVAIGECGLDKLITVDYELQFEVFKAQVLLSEKYQLPLVIHQVKAHHDVIKLKVEMNPTQPWIIHGVRLKWTIAKEFVDAGIYLSFGHHLLNADTNLHATFNQTPTDKIFLETDNSAIAIDDIFAKAAEIKSVEIETLKEIVYQNFKTVFKK